ncbi:MAG TPA: GNAT family protein [Thermoanaerobaculia bacterium]|jgi:RimJ/RimL family protein N-acetyltransferase|nr:GNAT family protein [Thermoanaerobaculia bacterium]
MWEQACEARLENEHVLLRPIVAEDREQFGAIAFDPDTWRYFVGRITTEEDLDRFIATAIDDIAAGRRVAFAVISKAAGAIAGSMSYGNMAEKDKRLEIGWSWLGKPYRGAGINRWAKYLLLEYAFETLACERVEFKTDVLNLQARKGLLNIGAKEEGVLRSYNFMPDGRRRDAIFYSILRREWPDVKEALRLNDKVRAGV